MFTFPCMRCYTYSSYAKSAPPLPPGERQRSAVHPYLSCAVSHCTAIQPSSNLAVGLRSAAQPSSQLAIIACACFRTNVIIVNQALACHVQPYNPPPCILRAGHYSRAAALNDKWSRGSATACSRTINGGRMQAARREMPQSMANQMVSFSAYVQGVVVPSSFELSWAPYRP